MAFVAWLLARLGFKRAKKCGCGADAEYDTSPTGEALCGPCAVAVAEVILERMGTARKARARRAAQARGKSKRRAKRKATGR